MYGFAKLSSLLCCVLAASVISHTAYAASTDDQILARLNALEKENAALRARVNRLESSTVRLERRRRATAAPSAPLELPQTSYALDARNSVPVHAVGSNASNARPRFYALDARNSVPVHAVGSNASNARPRFEVSGSLLFLQPASDDFDQYATLVNPFPVASPHWANQSINPKYSPAFDIGLRYMPTAFDDIGLDWTHLNATNNASVAGAPNQFVGPPYSIGPDAGAAFTGGTASGSLHSTYDSVNLDAGHIFCADCPFQLRVFGGVEFARIHDNLTGTFVSADGATSHQYSSDSLFTGAGPRLGIKGQYNVGNLQFFGQAAGAGLIGVSQMGINFVTASPILLGLGITNNYQSLTSPNATQVVPAFDAKVGANYTYPLSGDELLRLELGYQAAIYFDAVNSYALSNVAGSPLSGGMYLVTEQQLKSNFTTQGPYLTASWLF